MHTNPKPQTLGFPTPFLSWGVRDSELVTELPSSTLSLTPSLSGMGRALVTTGEGECGGRGSEPPVRSFAGRQGKQEWQVLEA